MRHALVLLIFLYFSCSLPNTSFWPPLREVLKPYAIASFSIHMVKHALKYFTAWESVCTGIFQTYFSLPLPYILSIFISTHMPKFPTPVWNYHAFRVVKKLSCEKQKFPWLLCRWKRHERNPLAIYIYSSLQQEARYILKLQWDSKRHKTHRILK